MPPPTPLPGNRGPSGVPRPVRRRFAKILGVNRLRLAFETYMRNFGGSGRGPGGRGPVWIVGTPVQYGFYLEVGTVNHPPYEWLRPAVDTAVNRYGVQIGQEADSIDEMVANMALAIEREAFENTSSRDKRPYPQTGNLMDSITAFPI